MVLDGARILCCVDTGGFGMWWDIHHDVTYHNVTYRGGGIVGANTGKYLQLLLRTHTNYM